MSENTRPHPDRDLLFSAAKRFGLGILILGLFLFVCAGSIRYWNAWLYLIALSAAIFSFGAYLFAKDKELLKKRLKTKEKEKAQITYVLTASISFLATFGLCGLDYRFGWSHVSVAVVVIALIVMLAGYGLFILTLMHNRFASRVVEVQKGQKVIDTGVYAAVRHPLYTAALIMFFSSPIVLGSYYATIPMLLFLVGIIFRIANEEKVLLAGLKGYKDYRKKVKYRLVPFIW